MPQGLFETQNIGTQLTGMLEWRDDNVETYVDINGDQVRIAEADSDQRVAASTLIMPGNLVDHLTDRELGDLMAFLMSDR